MKFTNLIIKNFKSLKDVNVELRNINVFAGSNGVGKSSLIQSILLAKTTAEQFSNARNEIEINGSYNLQLGRSEHLLNFSSEDEHIEFEFETITEDIVMNYLVDIFDKPFTLSLNEEVSKNIELFNSINLYYLGAERVGPSKGQSFDPQQKLKTGYKGEYTNHVISRADILNLRVDESMFNPDGLERFSTQVEAWMKLVFPGFKFTYNEIKDVDMVSVQYGHENLPQFIPQTATGFGITYTLPIITAALLATIKKDGILIVENPEAHLHPFGQSRLGQFLALISMNGVQVIIETHSEHIINGIRLQLSKNNKANKGIIHFFSQESENTINVHIDIKDNGELSEWPKGFFDQEKQDLFELLKIKRGKRS